MKNSRKKISYLQILKIVTQISFFVLLPGIYINSFAGIKLIYTGILENNLNIAESFPQLISAISVIPVTLLFGRFFCGWLCAFGTLGDMLYLFSYKVLKINFKVNEKLDYILKYIKYILLVLIILAVWSYKLIDISALSPWDAFGSLVNFHKIPNISYIITEFTIGFILLLAIIAASLFIERFFCRYLCPLGAVFSIISRIKFLKIKKPSDHCGSCKVCTKNCAMGIPLYKNDAVCSGECINCFRCVEKCPRKNIHVTLAGTITKPIIACILTVVIITGIYSFSSFAAEHISKNAVSTKLIKDSSTKSDALYKDGTYEGSGTGFGGGTTKISVTINGGKITNIKSLSNQDDPSYFNNAYDSIVKQIIAGQSANVDVVSGATFSSKGIMEAVSNALSKAKASGSSTNTQLPTQTSTIAPVPVKAVDSASITNKSTNKTSRKVSKPTVTKKATKTSNSKKSTSVKITDITKKAKSTSTPAPTKKPITTKPSPTNKPTPTSQPSPTASSKKYRDGVYEGSAAGFRRGTTTVSVTIKDDKITNIQVLSNQDTPQFFNRASTSVINDMLTSQTTSVDIVSGATFSSRGIMNAVANALGKAKN